MLKSMNSYTAVHVHELQDMQRMPPTTEPLSRDFLDETFFWIPAD